MPKKRLKALYRTRNLIPIENNTRFARALLVSDMILYVMLWTNSWHSCAQLFKIWYNKYLFIFTFTSGPQSWIAPPIMDSNRFDFLKRILLLQSKCVHTYPATITTTTATVTTITRAANSNNNTWHKGLSGFQVAQAKLI